MKKTLLMAAALLCLPCLANAQDEAPASPWTHNGITGLNLSSSSFTNWSEGGENSTSGNVYFNASLNYNKGKSSWTNDLDANFGLMKTQTQADWRKNMDNIHLASKYGRQITDKLYYAFLLDFKTQFAPGYDYATDPKTRLSDFMTPAYLNLSVGLDYKPDEHVSVYLSPAAGKMTYVKDTLFSTAYGLEQGKHLRMEFGATFKASANYAFFGDKLTVRSDVDMFTAYNESFGNVDINWNLLVGFKLSQYITATFQSCLKYDDDIHCFAADGTDQGPKVQFKEVLGLGLSYQF